MKRARAKKVILVCGARPNFMKVGPVWREMKKFPGTLRPVILHTGQHYDASMSGSFFADLELPEPEIHFGVGSGSQAVQTARIMTRCEEVLLKEKPDLVVVVGDVNSTLACALAAAKLLIPIAHVEAGLRSFDRTMPEEINRVLSDHLSDFLFTSCLDGNRNLRREGIRKEKTFFVGNVMIDTLVRSRAKIQRSGILKRLALGKRGYAVLTLHRPSNVDNRATFQRICGALEALGEHIPIIFPIHPRTLKRMKGFGMQRALRAATLVEPLGYVDFLKLCLRAQFVMTDSGGVQEETTYLRVPCLTLRENTERPVTVRQGSNVIVGTDEKKIISEGLKVLKGKRRAGKIPELWEGKAARRIVKVLRKAL